MAGAKKKGASKKAEQEAPKTKNDKFQEQLASLGLADALVLAEELPDLDVECMTTGFPDLDAAINEQLAVQGLSGLPRGRHSEVFSRKESSGKTSLALKIAAVLQALGLRVGIADIEKTITMPYLAMNGIKTKVSECTADQYPVYLLRSQYDFNEEDPEKVDVFCDDVLGIVKKAMNVFDFLIVDSVDALASKDDALKEVEDNRQVGGISKKLSAFFRENKNFRSHIMWVNQTREAVGAYNPSGGPTYKTTGGRALPFYATLRFELADVKTLVDNDVPYGFICQVKVIKDKIGPKGRFANLYYINGEGMSTRYSYFNQALKQGIITKVGGWYYILGEGKNIDERKKNAPWKCQGEYKSYLNLTSPEKQDIWDKLVMLVNGDVEIGTAEVDEAAAAESEAYEEEEAQAA